MLLEGVTRLLLVLLEGVARRTQADGDTHRHADAPACRHAGIETWIETWIHGYRSRHADMDRDMDIDMQACRHAGMDRDG